ncbi:MAG: ABC transporter permease, partial [Alphaproteobacteria bacterium]|nr:ABC transporter permease [Alphaproteobacteria bacterium]
MSDIAAEHQSTPARAALWRHAGAWALPLVLVILWEVAARNGLIRVRILPAPSSIAVALWGTIQDGSLLHNVAISSRRAFEGLAIGGGLGFILGVLTGASRFAETMLDSSLQML